MLACTGTLCGTSCPQQLPQPANPCLLPGFFVIVTSCVVVRVRDPVSAYPDSIRAMSAPGPPPIHALIFGNSTYTTLPQLSAAQDGKDFASLLTERAPGCVVVPLINATKKCGSVFVCVCVSSACVCVRACRRCGFDHSCACLCSGRCWMGFGDSHAG